MTLARSATAAAVVGALLGVLAGSAAAHTPPARPPLGAGPDFHLRAGTAWLAYDFQPHDAAGWPATRLDLRADNWGGVVAAAWTWAELLRIEAGLGVWPLDTGRFDVDGTVTSATAGALVPLIGNARLALSALGTLGVSAINLVPDSGDDQTLPGVEAGLGAALNLRLVGPLGLEARYRYLQVHYLEEEITLPGAAAVTIHADATAHVVSLSVVLDL